MTEPSPDVTSSAVEATTLTRYVDYRRAQIQAEIDGITTGPFSTGNVNRAEHYRALNIILTEFTNLADWLANGQPSQKAVITPEQAEHYRWAVSQGFPVSDEIKKELGI